MTINLVPVKFENEKLLEEINVSKVDFELKDLFSLERKQYYSTGIIEKALTNCDNLSGKVLLITDLDLYVPVLTFLFGEAQLNGKHSIVSLCRLRNEFYGIKSDKVMLLQRALKEILHELGHNFGLIHCIDWDCVMHSSNNIEEVDIKGEYYCTDCKAEMTEKLKE